MKGKILFIIHKTNIVAKIKYTTSKIFIKKFYNGTKIKYSSYSKVNRIPMLNIYKFFEMSFS